MLKRKRVCLIALATLVVAIVVGIFIWWNAIRFDFSEHMRIDDSFVELMQRDFAELYGLSAKTTNCGTIDNNIISAIKYAKLLFNIAFFSFFIFIFYPNAESKHKLS